MPIRSASVLIAWIGLGLAACAGPVKKPLVDPFPLRFPLVEAWTLEIEGHVVGQPRAQDGIVYYATREGFITAVVASSRSVLWRSHTGQPVPGSPEVSSGPVFVRDGGLLRALDGPGKALWEFRAGGTISLDPVRKGAHIYFGDSSRMFYCLDARSGQKKWSRRLQGAPAGTVLVTGGRVVVAASNSVVYTLSAKGGSILSWEAVPSRVLHPLTLAGPFVLVTSASQTLMILDPATGKRVGQHHFSGPAVAGAIWVPPYVVVFEEDPQAGRQRLVLYRHAGSPAGVDHGHGP